MRRLVTVATTAGLIGLAACNTGPTEPSSLSADPARQSLGGTGQLEAAEVSAQSEQDADRLRALIAALSSELSPGDGGGGDPPASDPTTVSIVGRGGLIRTRRIRLLQVAERSCGATTMRSSTVSSQTMGHLTPATLRLVKAVRRCTRPRTVLAITARFTRRWSARLAVLAAARGVVGAVAVGAARARMLSKG